MLSSYFYKKTKTKKFDDDLKWTIGELRDKKVLLYGAGEGFLNLLEKYPFKELNIVAISDRKFNEETTWNGFRAIPPQNIQNENYDFVLVTNEYTKNIIPSLINSGIEQNKIKTIFHIDIDEERDSIFYLEQFNFEKRLEKLKKHLKGKKIILYGAGVFAQAIMTYYDLSGLDIIGISDRKFSHNDVNEFYGYKTYAPEDIVNAKPDYVLVMNKFFVNLIDDLDRNLLRNTKIRLKPIVKKPFMVLWKEIFG